jgi:hypothetical protein
MKKITLPPRATVITASDLLKLLEKLMNKMLDNLRNGVPLKNQYITEEKLLNAIKNLQKTLKDLVFDFHLNEVVDFLDSEEHRIFLVLEVLVVHCLIVDPGLDIAKTIGKIIYVNTISLSF